MTCPRTAVAVACAATIAVLGACANGPNYTPPGGNTAYGSYPFRTVVNDAVPPLALEGVVILLPDTVVLTLQNSKCGYSADQRRTAAASFRYYCGDFSFSFSRKNPLRDQMYTVSYSAWEQQRVCATYRTNPRTNAEECARWSTERVQRRRSTSGRLRFIDRIGGQ